MTCFHCFFRTIDGVLVTSMVCNTLFFFENLCGFENSFSLLGKQNSVRNSCWNAIIEKIFSSYPPLGNLQVMTKTSIFLQKAKISLPLMWKKFWKLRREFPPFWDVTSSEWFCGYFIAWLPVEQYTPNPTHSWKNIETLQTRLCLFWHFCTIAPYTVIGGILVGWVQFTLKLVGSIPIILSQTHSPLIIQVSS